MGDEITEIIIIDPIECIIKLYQIEMLYACKYIYSNYCILEALIIPCFLTS